MTWTWQDRFYHDFWDRFDIHLREDEHDFILKYFTQLLSEVIDDIPDDHLEQGENYASTQDLRPLKQQLKDKYGIK